MTEDRFTTLYRTYGPTLYARCRRILGDDAAAADATQETFLRLHKHLDRVEDTSLAFAWISRVATHYCLNLVRNRRRHAEPVAHVPERQGPHLEQVLLDMDLARRLISRAPEKVATVAWLHHADGMSQDEVARVLGISLRTVVNRLAEFEKNAHKFARRSDA
jgi:RNA polymerase sigma-70 factor (ECF subfamily)